jgi:cell division protein FtsL
MAVARTQTAPSSGGTKVLTVALAVVAALSVTVAIIMATQMSSLQEELDNQEQAASRQRTEASQAKTDFRTLAELFVGEGTQNMVQAREAVTRIRERILSDQAVRDAGMQANAPVLTQMEDLYLLYEESVQDRQTLAAENQRLTNELQSTVETVSVKADAFEETIEDLESRYRELSEASEEFREQKNEAIAEMRADHEQQMEDVALERDRARQRQEEAESLLRREEARNEELLAQLAEFRPGGADVSALQIKDGIVLRSLSARDLAYIDLGREHGIKPGMTFSVYSAVRGIPADGQGKATLEVVALFPTTSECKITNQTPGEPVLAGDIVANPVYDRNRRFNFTVIGDFDLDLDGTIDDPGGERVSRLIRQWGGKVLGQVTAETDFLVLGSAPPQPDPMADDSAAAQERAETLAAQRERYQQFKEEANAMSVPILNRTRFLNFLGLGMSDTNDEVASR